MTFLTQCDKFISFFFGLIGHWREIAQISHCTLGFANFDGAWVMAIVLDIYIIAPFDAYA